MVASLGAELDEIQAKNLDNLLELKWDVSPANMRGRRKEKIPETKQVESLGKPRGVILANMKD